LEKKIDEIASALKASSIGDKPLTMVSPSVVQYDVEISRGVQIQSFKKIPGEPSFVNKKITKSNNEHLLIVKFTRKFNKFAESFNCKFVNTEEYSWIKAIHEDPKNDYKPDALLCRQGLYIRREESGTKDTKDNRKLPHIMKDNQFLFGEGEWDIRDMINCIMEWKNKYGPQDRGKMYGYLQHLAMKDPLSSFRGILCDEEKFLCVECVNMVMKQAVEGYWTDAGSLQYIKEFSSHRNHWLRLVDALCKEYNVQLKDNKEINSTAYLGSGKYGRCFVVTNGIIEYALKCVLLIDTNIVESGAKRTLVSNEYDVMLQYNKMKIEGVIKVHQDSLTVITEIRNDTSIELGIGYLMECIGKPITHHHLNKKKFREKIILSLCYFHKCDPPIYHGDPRITNAVLGAADEIEWIDFMYSVRILNRRHDISTLLQSIYGKEVLTQKQNLLSSYIDSDIEQLDNIAKLLVEDNIKIN
jgi:hypothetical protein